MDAEGRKKKEPFEYVAFWDHQLRPGRKDEHGQINDVEAVMSCARCGYIAHKDGRHVTRVGLFPKGRRRVCETCGGSVEIPHRVERVQQGALEREKAATG